MTRPKVFVSAAADMTHVAYAMREMLSPDADVFMLKESPSQGRTILESILAAVDRADLAVVLLSADTSFHPRSRENVVFELGLLVGKLGRSRVFVLTPDVPGLRLPSDLSGLPVLRYIPSQSEGDLRPALESALAMIRSSLTKMPSSSSPSDYYSCFLSYSATDQSFVRRLYDDLQEAGIRCWLDSRDMRVGDSIIDTLDRNMSAHDRVLLVLSSASLGSRWVRHEVVNALELERRSSQSVLFPIRIDHAVFDVKDPVYADLRDRKHIADFEQWQEPDQYRRAFSRLVKDLTIAVARDITRKVL